MVAEDNINMLDEDVSPLLSEPLRLALQDSNVMIWGVGKW